MTIYFKPYPLPLALANGFGKVQNTGALAPFRTYYSNGSVLGGRTAVSYQKSLKLQDIPAVFQISKLQFFVSLLKFSGIPLNYFLTNNSSLIQCYINPCF